MTVAVERTGIRDPAAFIRANTQTLAPPLVPEVRLHQASEVTPIREATQATLDALGDPRRAYMPKRGLEQVVKYSVPTARAIEDTDPRNAVVWRMMRD